MKRYMYLDLECKVNPHDVGWKNFAAQGMSVGVIGIPSVWSDYTTEKAKQFTDKDLDLDPDTEKIYNLFPDGGDLYYEVFTDPLELYKRLKDLIGQDFVIVSYNGIRYDNNLIASLIGEENPKEWLKKPIGGNKGSTTWDEVDDGYLSYLIKNKVGAWKIAQCVLNYKQDMLDMHMGVESELNEEFYISNIKKLLDDNTYDILNETIKLTGGRWGVRLDLACKSTINYGKNDDGAKVPEMYANGEIDRITKYCINDVRILWLLHEFILKWGYMLMPSYKEYPNLAPNNMIKIPFDGSVSGFDGASIDLSVFD